MKRLFALSLLATIIVGAFGCDLTGPGDLVLAIHSLRSEPGDDWPSPPRAVGAQSTIVVRGRTGTASSCESLGADLGKQDSDVTLTLKAVRGSGTGCPGIPGTWGYVATILDVPGGHTRLRVAHTWPAEEVVLDTIIVVE